MEINIKKIKPLFNSIITTMDLEEENTFIPGTQILDTTKKINGIKEYQKVIAVGDIVKSVKVGDLVCINPIRYAIKQHKEGTFKDGVITDNMTTSYKFNTITIDNNPYLFLSDNDIKFVVEEYEEIKQNPLEVDSSIIS